MPNGPPPKSLVFWRNSGYNPLVTTKSDLIEEAIGEANRNFENTFRSGIPEAMAHVYTEDAQLMPAGTEPIVGSEAIAEFWGGVMRLGIKHARLETLELDPQGATVIEVGKYTLFADGEKVLDRGKYVVVWKLIKGEWKLHRDIWNTSLAPPAA